MITRRQLNAGLVSAAGLAILAPLKGVLAQSGWQPTEDVEFVIPFGAGGGADILARLLIEIINEEKLVPVAVQPVNHPGGGGAVGYGYVAANRSGNPHTLVLMNGGSILVPIEVPGAAGWQALHPVLNVMFDEYLFVVKGDAKWQSMEEFLAEAKAAPPRTFSIAGGPADNLAGKIMGLAAGGVEFNAIVVSGGGEALQNILGGHVDATVINPLEILGQLESGALRALAVFAPDRLSVLPEVPTLAEQGVTLPARISNWRGVAMPKGVPEEAATYWQGVMEKVVQSKRMADYIKQNAAILAPMKGDEYQQFLISIDKLYREASAA